METLKKKWRGAAAGKVRLSGRGVTLCALLCAFFLAAADNRASVKPQQALRAPAVPADEAPALAQPVPDAAALTGETLPALEYYPIDTLFICAQRRAYQDGDLLLEVPRLGLCAPVQNGTDDAALLRGVGLYEISPLPGTGNPNVSIAGHRGAAGHEFYDLDKLCDGDTIRLTYKGWRYTYLWEKTTIVEPDDWSAVYCTGTSRVTLTSCHPKTGSSHRICASGALICVEAVG